jgi:glycosyltransferase involved in cell wall biosynthesis
MTTSPKKTTVVIPIHNSSSTLIDSISSLDDQVEVDITLIIVDDFGGDNCNDLVESYFVQRNSGQAISSWQMIVHPSYTGLAGAYNSGIRASSSSTVVFMQPDIRLPSQNELSRLIQPFEDCGVVAATHQSVAPSDSYWRQLNLWGKAFLAPSLFARAQGFNGQFDAIRRSALIEIGLFDGARYRNAGEDGDIIFRLSKVGKIVGSGARAQHCHNFGKDPTILNYQSKALQYGNAQGALLRNRSLPGLLNKMVIFHRELLCALFLASFFSGNRLVTFLSLVALFGSSSRLVFKLALTGIVGPVSGMRLFVGELLKHPVHFLGSAFGFAQGKQRLRVLSDLFKRN